MGGESCIPTLAMVTVQVGYAGMNVLSKLALDDGMSPFVITAYRQVVATLILFPIAFFLEREAFRLITGKVIVQILFSSIFGATLNQVLYFLGLKLSTPTIACALTNILPAITFIIAIPFRMETVGFRTLAGQAKVVGTVLCVGGSMLMTFYRGGLIRMWSSPIHWRYAEEMSRNAGADAGSQNMALGAALVIVSCLAWAIWFIIQAKMSKSFSSPYTSSAMLCFMAGVQCLVLAACTDRKASAWAMGWDIRLAASVYAGLIGSGLAVSLMSWCIAKRGPLFVSMFSPLLLITVAVFGWAILDEKLYVGSAIGSVLIVGGLYMVLWGKGREIKQLGQIQVVDKEEDDEEGGSLSAISLAVLSSTPKSPRHQVEAE
ncbi:WAT1-related protein At1g09380-like [Zingiber officinale]|uniref:WAT1-related protein At1g09380-like n=1 Tax=Zingiber officinale TaxID=94328 RepID=UPI001C4B1FE6|nr:WAT1-related protein At1g09380-like [Zingiber officinale]